MNRHQANSDNGFNAVLNHLAVDKKALVAVCLVVVMVLMWARVLLKKSPASASAQAPGTAATSPVNEDGQTTPLKIRFVDLPKVPGRNDSLSRDFFASAGWKDFLTDRVNRNISRVEEGGSHSTDGSEEIQRVAQKLKLEAIELGKNPQAFINGKLLGPGDTLTVREGARTYECEIVGIEENTVFVKCGLARISLRLEQSVEVAN